MKMKKYIALAGLALALPLATSCSKEFLDPPVVDYVTEEHRVNLVSDPAVLEDIIDASLSASYSVFQDYWSSHDDFGLKAFQLATDMYGEDIAYRGGWFSFDYMYDNFEADYRRTNSTWSQFYDVIAKSNLLLRDYFKDAKEDDAAVRKSKAKPLALRGISLYYLVTFYQANYQLNPDALGVPIPLKPEDEFLARSTVKEVYQQILDDLSYAVENGEVTSDTRTDADRAVAAAYLAKAYADMADWANAEKYAKIAQEGGSDAVLKYPPSWSIMNGDVLWGFDVTPVTSTSWASFYAHMDPTIAFYAGKSGQRKYIYNWLYDQMGEQDVRRTLFVNSKDNPSIAKENGFEPYEVEEKQEDGTTKKRLVDFEYTALKYKTTEAANTDYIFLRVQDPILLEIEALNEQGKTAEAATKLNAFVTKRDPGFVASATQEELRNQIRIQRRIELWGEGTSFNDFKRWNIDVDRTKVLFKGEDGKEHTTSNHGFLVQKNLNAPRNIHLLPQREINNNKKLVQNVRPEE